MFKSAAVIFLFSCASLGQNATHDSIDSELKNELAEAKARLQAQEKKQHKIFSGLTNLNRKIRSLVGQKADLGDERMVLEEKLKETSRLVTSLEKQISKQKKVVRKRLASMYRFGTQGGMRLMLSSSHPAILDRNAKILGLFTQRDVHSVKELQESQRSLKINREKFLAKDHELKELELKIADRERRMLQEQEQRKKILSILKRSHSFDVARLQDLRNQSENIETREGAEGLIDFLSKPAFADLKGLLPSPVHGRIKINFGLIRDSEDQTVINHKGLFFQASRGESVVAVAPGSVVHVGPIDGFNEIVILDHGDHYYTIYAQLQQIFVREGEEVQSQTLLGQTSYSSYYKSEGFYFETRHFSEPFDPKPWLADFRIDVSSRERDL